MFSKTYSTDGTWSGSSVAYMPGDVAALVRYSTADRSSKNHPIYLFNYYHAIAGRLDSVDFNKPNVGEVTALGTYAAAWVSGFSDGTTTHKRSRPNESVATGYLVETYFTHRDLPH